MPPPVEFSTAVRFQFFPDILLLVVLLAGGYAYLLSTLGPTHAPAHLRRTGFATRQQKAMFYGGVMLFLIGGSWPIHSLGEDYLYSVHMVQHLLFQLAAAPLLLLGTPAWLFRALLTPRLTRIVRAATKPLPAIVLVNTFVAIAHTPLWVDTSVTNGLFHLFTHVMWVLVGLLMWWPVFSPLPELPHYSYLGRMAYLFSHSIVPTVPASFLTFSSAAIYTSYASAPRIWEAITPVVDLQIAGLIMKIGGGLFMWSIIAVMFFRWSREEKRGEPDFLYWRDYAGTDMIPELTEQRGEKTP
ncbi:cytochrome c oxidase assembly protein [Euzebya tangerina]|uniref:cytochrome c oxidase assembly protein n=1 Tax=Euzebya tangerina TaxID=591198 RepID=UPI000E31539B|nr:cytochrome c oxidase assembly protein [Euzebya tangerina]